MVVGVIIPARNEAAALGQVLAELPRALIHETLVVDNGSTDGTADVARRAGARVVQEPIAGYGRACLAGIAALDPSTEMVVFMDADHSDDPADLPKLLAPITEGRADLVIGSRVARADPGSLTVQQRLGNRLACALMRWLFGVRYTDLGPFRAIRRDALQRLQMRDQAFGWTVEMQAKAARAGLRIVEVPVRYHRRIGRSKISGTLSGAVRAGVAIIATILRVAWGFRSGCRRLVVFLRYPVPGHVKTRLSRELGDDEAAAAYKACVEQTLEGVRRFRDEAVLYVDPPDALEPTRSWLGDRWVLAVQQGATLGDRLQQATRRAFADGARSLVIIGTDSPWISAEDIDAAFDALGRSDVVIGPAEDGGYYLIGLSRPVPELFEEIAWGSAEVFSQTMQKARARRLRVHLLPQGYDVDRLEDLERWRCQCQS